MWPILKDIPKFTTPTSPIEVSQRRRSGSSSPQIDFPCTQSPTSPSPGLSPFSVNITDKDIGGSSFQRPVGVKKAKLKNLQEEQNSKFFESVTEER